MKSEKYTIKKRYKKRMNRKVYNRVDKNEKIFLYPVYSNPSDSSRVEFFALG